jgi:glc operon protein GlcG
MPDFVPTYRLTHEASLRMLAAGVAKAAEIDCKVSLAVVDQSGQLLAFLMMDGTRFFSGRATIKKALTSASQRLPTGYAPAEEVLSLQIRMDGDFTNVPGGFPITIQGQVVGGIAAGGARSDEDVVIAKAALAALDAPNPGTG